MMVSWFFCFSFKVIQKYFRTEDWVRVLVPLLAWQMLWFSKASCNRCHAGHPNVWLLSLLNNMNLFWEYGYKMLCGFSPRSLDKLDSQKIEYLLPAKSNIFLFELRGCGGEGHGINRFNFGGVWLVCLIIILAWWPLNVYLKKQILCRLLALIYWCLSYAAVLPFLERTTFFLYPIGVFIGLAPIRKFPL